MVSRFPVTLAKERDNLGVNNIGKTVTKIKDIQIKDIDSINFTKAQITIKNNSKTKNMW